MNFVERGDLDGDDVKKYLEELLFEYKTDKVDAVVLGCTHYPFVKEHIQEVLGDEVLVFDGGAGTAREMKRRLEEKNLLENKKRMGNVKFDNSLLGEAKNEKIVLCERLFTKNL